MSTAEDYIEAAVNRASSGIRDGTLVVVPEIRDTWNGYFGTEGSGIAGAGRLIRRAVNKIRPHWSLVGRPGSQEWNHNMATLRDMAEGRLVQVIQAHINADSSPESSTSRSF